jgi:hypothetical protein
MDMLPSTGSAAAVMNDDSSLARNSLAPRESIRVFSMAAGQTQMARMPLVAYRRRIWGLNPNTQTKEFSLRDPDGYYVTISALSAA